MSLKTLDIDHISSHCSRIFFSNFPSENHSDSQVNEVKSPQVVKSPKVEKEVVPEQKEIVPSPRMST